MLLEVVDAVAVVAARSNDHGTGTSFPLADVVDIEVELEMEPGLELLDAGVSDADLELYDPSELIELDRELPALVSELAPEPRWFTEELLDGLDDGELEGLEDGLELVP